MRSPLTILFAVAFHGAIGMSVFVESLPSVIFLAYATLSLITFAAYAIDKSAARRGGWRTGEGTLLLFGFAGGWPGALIAQQTLRHKSKKTSFRVALWATIILNCAAIAWLHTGKGRAWLDVLPGGNI